MQVAEGAPDAAVEGKHDRSAFELVGEANPASLPIRQLEVCRPVSDGERLRKRHGREARLLFCEALLDAGVDRLGTGHRADLLLQWTVCMGKSLEVVVRGRTPDGARPLSWCRALAGR